MNLELLQGDLEVKMTQLRDKDDALEKAEDENRRLNNALTDTQLKLVLLEDRSVRVEERGKQMSSRLEVLEKDLSAAELREIDLSAQKFDLVGLLDDAENRYKSAETEVATYQKAMTDTEASLEREKESNQNLLQQLQQMEFDMSKQLSYAEHRYQEANMAVENCQKAKNDIEKSLAHEKQVCQNLQQRLQQMQRETSEQEKMLKMELGQSNLEITRLKDELQMSKLKLDQQQDYKKSYNEGWFIRPLCHNVRCKVGWP